MIIRALFKSEHKLVAVRSIFLVSRYWISSSNAVQELHHDYLCDEDHTLLEERNYIFFFQISKFLLSLETFYA